jgi:hypothetical protein
VKTVLRRGLIGVAVLAVGIAVGRYTPPPRDCVTRPDDEPAAAARPAPRCWEATVYLPLADNQGQPFSEGAWQETLAVLVVPFGGATLGPPQEGCWLDVHGRVCREQVRPVVISFAPERLDEFRGVVRAVGRRLGQEAMYVRFEEPRVELIPGGSL